MDKIKIYHVWGILALKFISLRFKLSPIIHCMKRSIVLEFVKEIFCDLEEVEFHLRQCHFKTG